MPSFGGDVKLSVPCLLNVRQVKDPYSSYGKRFGKISWLGVARLQASVIGLGSGKRPTLNK